MANPVTTTEKIRYHSKEEPPLLRQLPAMNAVISRGAESGHLVRTKVVHEVALRPNQAIERSLRGVVALPSWQPTQAQWQPQGEASPARQDRSCPHHRRGGRFRCGCHKGPGTGRKRRHTGLGPRLSEARTPLIAWDDYSEAPRFTPSRNQASRALGRLGGRERIGTPCKPELGAKGLAGPRWATSSPGSEGTRAGPLGRGRSSADASMRPQPRCSHLVR